MSRLILRPQALTDVEAVYEQVHNPKIGAMCGWPPRTGVTESREIIKHVLCRPHSFAICLGDNRAIGNISLLFRSDNNLPMSDREAGVGYQPGESFWGKGYATEAVQSVVAYVFEELFLVQPWGETYQKDTPSRRVLEKYGFYPRHTEEHFFSKPTGETHRAVIYALEKA